MEQKLTIPEITYMRALAGIKTDEQLATMMNKPVELIKLQFSIMANVPKRPEEKPAVIAKLLATDGLPATSVFISPVKEKKGKAPKPEKKKRVSHAERRLIREQKEAEKQKQKPKAKQSANVMEMEQRMLSQNRNRRSTYAMRPLDLTGKVPVKLNSKTIVYVNPGADIEKLKKKYNIA